MDAKWLQRIKSRLEELRTLIIEERISYSEIEELKALAHHIEPGDTLLLEWAGVPEHPEEEYRIAICPHLGTEIIQQYYPEEEVDKWLCLHNNDDKKDAEQVAYFRKHGQYENI
jgi:hypothetical protein